MAQVCMHTLSGQRWRFECPSGSTFKDLKSHIMRSLRIAKRMQHLLVDGSRAMPHEMLERYATDDALGVTLVVAPAVCGFCGERGAPLNAALVATTPIIAPRVVKGMIGGGTTNRFVAICRRLERSGRAFCDVRHASLTRKYSVAAVSKPGPDN